MEVETYTHTGRDGDVYLLCSDGLTGMVSEDRIAEILRETPSLEDAARRLIDAANENGGKDNITAVLFRLGDSGKSDEESDTLGDQATDTGLSAHEVRAAVAEQRDQATMVVRPAEAEAARAAPQPPSKPPFTGKAGKGLDIGTVNLVAAEQNNEAETELRLQRNVFIDVEITPYTKAMLTKLNVGYVIQGRITVRLKDGTQKTIGAGESYTIPPGHDAWVVGDEPCIALDFVPK